MFAVSDTTDEVFQIEAMHLEDKIKLYNIFKVSKWQNHNNDPCWTAYIIYDIWDNLSIVLHKKWRTV